MGVDEKEKKIQTRGQGSTGIVVDSLNGREAPGRAGALPREPLTSGGRLGYGHPRQSTDGRVSAARPPACPPPYPPRVRPPGAAARRWPASSDASGDSRQLQRSGPPGAAPLPPLPAAAALTSERTRHRQPPTALTLFGERTNTLEATASPPPPSARPAPAHAHAGSALPGSWDARAARREGEFSPRRSSVPPPAGGDMEAGVRALVQPSSAGKPLRSPPRLLPVRSSLR